MKKIFCVILALCMLFAIVACATPDAPDVSDPPPTQTQEDPLQPADQDTEDPVTEDPPAALAVNPNIPDYTYILPYGQVFDINAYYNDLDPLLAANVTIRQTGGLVSVSDNITTPMPVADGDVTIGFSVYYTVDEVGSMILDEMVRAAELAGVTLLVHDAHYDQNAQNMAVEQWILQGVDGVILAPCDFHGVSVALDMLEEAGIPVVSLNAPLAGTVDSVVLADCVEQGYMAGQLLIDYLNAQGTPISGKIVINQINFLHPNAVLREAGFRDAFANYDIEFIVVDGLSPEDHFLAFEGALLAHSDMIGAYGIYSSATIGMMNAKRAHNADVPIVSIDNDRLILAGIYDGTIVGSIAYSAITPSWWAMSLMVNLLNGVNIPGTLFYENKAVTPANVAAMFEHYYPGYTLADFLAGG